MKFFVKLVLLIFAVAIGRFAYEKAVDLPLFALKEIELEGNSLLEPDSVLRISELEMGKSIYRQNIKYAADRISVQSGVIGCSVNRGFISSISIRIDSARPVLMINGDKPYGLSGEGMILPIERNTPDLPMVTGRKFSRVKCYETLNDPDIVYALELYRELLSISPEFCKRLSEINFGDDGTMKIVLAPGGTMAVINKRDIHDSARRICALDKNEILEESRIFDLRFGPVVVESSIKKGIL